MQVKQGYRIPNISKEDNLTKRQMARIEVLGWTVSVRRTECCEVARLAGCARRGEKCRRHP